MHKLYNHHLEIRNINKINIQNKQNHLEVKTCDFDHVHVSEQSWVFNILSPTILTIGEEIKDKVNVEISMLACLSKKYYVTQSLLGCNICGLKSSKVHKKSVFNIRKHFSIFWGSHWWYMRWFLWYLWVKSTFGVWCE